MSGRRRQYSPEFREKAARMVVDSSRPIAHVAREIGVHEITLGYWVKAYRAKHPGASRRWRSLSGRGYASWSGRTASSKRSVSSWQKLRRTSRRSIGKLKIRVHRCGVRRRHGRE
ncbi:MAG: transposase [Pseudonocardiaceae bacterium]